MYISSVIFDSQLFGGIYEVEVVVDFQNDQLVKVCCTVEAAGRLKSKKHALAGREKLDIHSFKLPEFYV